MPGGNRPVDAFTIWGMHHGISQLKKTLTQKCKQIMSKSCFNFFRHLLYEHFIFSAFGIRYLEIPMEMNSDCRECILSQEEVGFPFDMKKSCGRKFTILHLPSALFDLLNYYRILNVELIQF